MWTFVVFVSLVSWADGQHRNPRQHQGMGYLGDIRLAVPGDPGSDYPTLGNIPRTSFSCSGKAPGYYADLETNCQAFRVCTSGSTYGFQSFLCPNGTLFNQAVFVCDWWMNVNCQKSGELINNNNDKFGNLRLGPELMKDIKKMITHPMRNPYDKSTMKNNLIVMQDYRPPPNPMFGALMQGAARSPNSIYTPAKQIQAPYNQNSYSNGNVFAASTPSPSYVPPPLNSFASSQRDAEVFQRQRQNGQYQQSTQSTPISNGHAVQFQQNQQQQNLGFSFGTSNSVSRPIQVYNSPAQYRQQQQEQTIGNSQSFNQQINQQRGQFRQNGQFTDGRNQVQLNAKQTGFDISYRKQQYTAPVSNDNNGQYHTEAKQNLVSDETPATIVTKTLTVNRIVDPEPGKPKSRITIKTWIIKPTKAAKLIAEPSFYNYLRPTNPTSEKQVAESPYVYNPPTTAQSAKHILGQQDYPYNRPTAAKLVEQEGYPYSRPTVAAKLVEQDAYSYSRPTVAAKQVEQIAYTYSRPTVAAKQIEQIGYSYSRPTVAAKQVEQTGYSYSRPTAAAKQVEGPYEYQRPTVAAKIVTTIREPVRSYLPPPTTPQPALSRLYANPNTPPPTVPSKLYIPPTTYKPAAKLYLPPSQPNVILSRQYLAPGAIQQPAYSQSAKLKASPSTPTPVYAAPPDNPSFSLTKHSHTKTNHNNLTFADILTKEKLDITVNDIVSDTSKILQTASPQTEQFGQYRQEKDYSGETYVSSDVNNESDERLTSQPPTVAASSSRLIAGPVRELEPPVESYDSQNLVSTNKLANLAYYKEPETSTKTIERTVSLKISIPEKVASYLFKNHNESDYDKLEILNTGSSNYLVLTNNVLTNKNPGANFIPIGRLIADKNTNISNSQALVFNFLADSLNQAKEYSNIAKQNIAPTPAQFPGVNNQELAQITNQISELTASQYANQNNYNPGNVVSQTNGAHQYQAAKYTSGLTQNQQQINPAPARLTSQQAYSYQNQNSAVNDNLQLNQNQIYSGQLYKLPVPDVTNHIYNAGPPISSNLIQGQYSAPNGINQNGNNSPKQSSAEVEIVQSQTLPIGPAPAKLQQFTPSNEAETFNSHEHSSALLGNFLNNGNGISAQLQDKIVGTLPHPLEDDKLVTYKKDQSYFVYTNFNNNAISNNQVSVQTNVQSAKIGEGQPNIVFQFVPSVSYQLEDEKEQQKLLNSFQIDEFGSPKNLQQVPNNHRREDLISEVNYAVDHPQSAKQISGVNEVNTLYAGPSSYSAPQASVGSLEAHEEVLNNLNARLELEESNKYNNGY